MRDWRSRDPSEEVGEIYQTGIKPGAVTLTQHLPLQRKARTDARPALEVPPMESFGFIQAYGGDVKPAGNAAFPDQAPTPWMAAETGTSGAAGPLPHFDQIQRSFGRHDVSGVRAYTDANATAGATAMGAEAFATGDQVAFAGVPTLHTAAHEAAHVVQQRAGVALKGGVGQAGDAYERHADAVADKVVAGESAESLLDEMAGAGGGASRAIQKTGGNTNQGQADAAAAQQGGAQPGGQQQQQPTPKEQAKGAMAAFMQQLTVEWVNGIKAQDDFLLNSVLLGTFEADWFKAKECLLFDHWPVPKSAPDKPTHEAGLALMDALVAMRSRKCKIVADAAQAGIKEALRAETQQLTPQHALVQQGVHVDFISQVTADKTPKDHFNPLAPTGAEKRTSDIDVASNGLNTEIGVRLFNQKFREILGVDFDPATVFDYNVYAMDWIFPGKFEKQDISTETNRETGAREEVAKDVTPKPEHSVSADTNTDSAAIDSRVQQGREEILDDAALLHIRRNCSKTEWKVYMNSRLAQETGDKNALRTKLQAVDTKFQGFEAEVEEREEAMGQQMNAAAKQAQSAWDSDTHMKEAVESRARNALYEQRLLKVKALRLNYQVLKDKQNKSPQDLEQMGILATQVTAALTDAVFFANEVYATEGATLHATQAIQAVSKAKAKYGVDVTVHLSDAQYMQSFHENVGDSLHSLGHFSHEPKYAAYRAGKYIERMILAGEVLAEQAGVPEALTSHPQHDMLKELGAKAATIKNSAAGDDPAQIDAAFPEINASSLPPLRQAVLTFGGDFPGKLQNAKAAKAQAAQQNPAQAPGEAAQPGQQAAVAQQAAQVQQNAQPQAQPDAQAQPPQQPAQAQAAPGQQAAQQAPQQAAQQAPAERGILATILEALSVMVDGFIGFISRRRGD